MKPPYEITNKILKLVSDISAILGSIESKGFAVPEPQLRKANKIKTIQGTLSIEGNTLSLDQITALLNGEKVLGPANEIQEAINTNELYDQIHKLKYLSSRDLLKAHKVLMHKLIPDAGEYRSKNVGILKGSKVAHVAPKPRLVPELIIKLLDWAKKNRDIHPLILSCVLHYEIEFIHPFSDGNGRVGRFWQTLVLSKFDPIFQYIPIESVIKRNQKKYYKVLGDSDKSGESTIFIEFMLEIILKSLIEFNSEIKAITNTFETRMNQAKKHFKEKYFSRKDYMILHKTISSATASRDLKEAVEDKVLKRSGSGNQTKYTF